MLHGHALCQAICLTVEVCVVVTIRTGRIELVNSNSAGPAAKQFANSTVNYGVYRSAARFHDVDRLMGMSIVNFIEAIVKLRSLETVNR